MLQEWEEGIFCSFEFRNIKTDVGKKIFFLWEKNATFEVT